MRLRYAFRFVAVALLVAGCGSTAGPSVARGSHSLGTPVAATPTAVIGRPAPDVASRALADRARADGRGDVAVCLYVDPSTGIDARVALASLQGTIDGLVGQGYTVLGPRPAEPCPAAPLFIRTDTVHPKNNGNGPVAAVPRVATPGPFLLYLAITTPARIDRVFGGLTIRRGAEEMTCSGDNCGEVTGSIYVDASRFASGAERERVLLEGLGLLGG